MHPANIYALKIQEMEAIRNTALGYEKADLALINGDIVNVNTGELQRKHSVAIKGEKIAYIGTDIKHTIGPNTKVLDVSGKILVPGFIDSHAHLCYFGTPDELLRFIMVSGTTTIVTELVELSYTVGYKGILEYLTALKNQPIKIFATVPCPLLINKSGYRIAPNISQLKSLLTRDDIVGLGESYWTIALDTESIFPELAAEALKLGKTVEGHAAGAHDKKLISYIAQGVSSCHEAINIEELLERLRLGLFSMIREGSIRKELDAMSNLTDLPIDLRHVSLVTDGIDPRELINKGYLEAAVQRAIDKGFDPIKTIQMVTINPAQYFHLDNFIGSITPCKQADIVVLPGIKIIKAEYVISNGKLIAEQGKALIQPHKSTFSLKGFKKMLSPTKPDDFNLRTTQTKTIKVRVIDQVTELVTRELIADLVISDEQIKPDLTKDILKVSLITWQGKIINGFIHGIGLNSGAIASSSAWETFGILVIGQNENDMANAVNRVINLNGGMAVYANNELLAELSFPIGGVMTSISLESLADNLNLIQQKATSLGCGFKDMLLTMAVLTTAAIPYLRISENGILDLKKNKLVDLIVEK